MRGPAHALQFIIRGFNYLAFFPLAVYEFNFNQCSQYFLSHWAMDFKKLHLIVCFIFVPG